MEHGVVDVCSESALNRFQVGAVGVGGQLDAVADTAGAILHEIPRPSTVTAPNKVANHQLCIRIHTYPGPNVSPSFRLLCGAGVLLLAADKAPDFIRLHPANLEVPNVEIVEGSAGSTHIRKELGNGILCCSGHSASRPYAATFNEAADDLGAGLGVQTVHTDHYAIAALACQGGGRGRYFVWKYSLHFPDNRLV